MLISVELSIKRFINLGPGLDVLEHPLEQL